MTTVKPREESVSEMLSNARGLSERRREKRLLLTLTITILVVSWDFFLRAGDFVFMSLIDFF